jgi:hypothetical protein
VSVLLIFIALFSTGFGLTLRAKNATKAFGDMKCWNVELANSLQDRSIDTATAAKTRRFAELEALQVHNPKLAETVRTNEVTVEMTLQTERLGAEVREFLTRVRSA